MKWTDRNWESKPGTLVSLQFTWRDCWKLESAFRLFLLFGRVRKFDVSFSYEQIKRFWLNFSKKNIVIDFELSYAHWLKEGARCIGTVPAEDVDI